MALSNSQADDEFYIGYLPQAPKSYSRLIKPVIIGLFILAAGIAAYLALHQKGFSNSSFEYGTLTDVEGILYTEPAPFLKVKTGTDASGKDVYKTVLLINFLKSGASELVQSYARQINQPLNQTLVKLRGTLLYHDGITLLELTEQEKALIGFSASKETHSPLLQDLGKITLKGEIVDPKCYFGAMKPGENKPHRSCAIRCISGGIPPVMVVKNESGEASYFLMVGENGQAINKEVLAYVAEPVAVTGQLIRYDDWYVLQINPQQNISRID